MTQPYSTPETEKLTGISFNWRTPSRQKGPQLVSRDVRVLFGGITHSGDRGRTSPRSSTSLFAARRANDTHNVTVVEDVGFSKTHSTPSVDTVQNVLAQVSMNS